MADQGRGKVKLYDVSSGDTRATKEVTLAETNFCPHRRGALLDRFINAIQAILSSTSLLKSSQLWGCMLPLSPTTLLRYTDKAARLPKSSYYDENYRASAALLRARQPYLVKNLIVGGSLLALTLGICWFYNTVFGGSS